MYYLLDTISKYLQRSGSLSRSKQNPDLYKPLSCIHKAVSPTFFMDEMPCSPGKTGSGTGTV